MQVISDANKPIGGVTVHVGPRKAISSPTGQIIKATGEMSSNMKNSLLKQLGVNIDKFDEMAEATGKFLTKERHIFAKKSDDTLATAKNAFKQTEEGMEDMLQMKRAKEASKQTIDELDDLVKKGGKAGDADMEDAIMRMQKDKTAQGIMNGADVPPEVRKKANETIKNIYKDTDVPTMNRIKNSDDIKNFASDHGLDPDSIEVTVWNPTNTKEPKIGEPGYVDPDYVKFGRDRDVTYQIKGKTADGRTVTLDVNHDVSGPIYQDEFFKRCNGRPPVDAAETKKLANALDSVSDVGRKSDMITEAYQQGHISGKTYCQMRQGSFKLPPNPIPVQKEQLKTWAISVWHRRGISLTEKKDIEAQVGPLE